MIRKDVLRESFDKEKIKELDEYIATRRNREQEVINILHRTQKIFGYLSEELQIYLAHEVGIPTAKINGIVSFYSYFHEEPAGKYNISVCMGTACYVKGAGEVLEAFKKELGLEEKNQTDDGLFQISEVRCIGACGLAPVVSINEKIVGHLTPEKVKDVVDEYRKNEGIYED